MSSFTEAQHRHRNRSIADEVALAVLTGMRRKRSLPGVLKVLVGLGHVYRTKIKVNFAKGLDFRQQV